MTIIDIWNVEGALHNPKGILHWANVPDGHVEVVFA